MRRRFTKLFEMILTGIGVLAMNAGAIIAELDN